MKGFYLLLGAVALIGGGVLWYGSQAKPERGGAGNGGAAPLPVAATDGFRGYTLGSDSAPVEIREYSDFECPFCAAFATVQMPVIREQLIATAVPGFSAANPSVLTLCRPGRPVRGGAGQVLGAPRPAVHPTSVGPDGQEPAFPVPGFCPGGRTRPRQVRRLHGRAALCRPDPGQRSGR